MIRRLLLIAFLTATALAVSIPASAIPTFKPEDGQRLLNASPESMTGSYTGGLRLYFTRDFRVLSATSTDGLAWAEEPGVRVSSESSGGGSVVFSSITSASVLPLDSSGFRMLMTVAVSSSNYRIVSATSSDGVNWGLEETKFIFSTNVFAGSARLIEDTGGLWRLFYVRALSTGFSSSTYRVFSAESSDEGVTWSAGVQALADEAHDITISSRTDSSLRIYYTAPETSGGEARQLLSAQEVVQPGNLIFARETGVRLSTSAGTIHSPLVFRAAESFRLRAYHAFRSSGAVTSPVTVSAITLSPDPQLLAPNVVTKTAVPGTFIVYGEIFDSSPTAKLVRAGEADIIGTGVTSETDQRFTLSFNTLNATLGRWDLKVTNSDLVTTTLTNALEVTFETGQVTPLDNVFRPLRGQQVHFDVTTFNPGRLVVKLYTLEGRYIRTLFDGDAAPGTTGVNWDGRTEDGNRVASGVYIVSFKGEKLDTREKVVVIK